jgi:hypothetical protein
MKGLWWRCWGREGGCRVWWAFGCPWSCMVVGPVLVLSKLIVGIFLRHGGCLRSSGLLRRCDCCGGRWPALVPSPLSPFLASEIVSITSLLQWWGFCCFLPLGRWFKLSTASPSLVPSQLTPVKWGSQWRTREKAILDVMHSLVYVWLSTKGIHFCSVFIKYCQI